MERRIYNPIQKDYVTFLQTAEETEGQSTLVEVELAPKGGVGLHYHKTYSEAFECVDGELKVQLGKVIHTLTPGQSARAVPLVHHRFFNSSEQACRFRVELNPASRGFEQSLQIGYGLARDGLVRKSGIPKDRHVLAWLFEISESNLPGWMSIFEFILRRQALAARRKGVDQELIRRYVMF